MERHSRSSPLSISAQKLSDHGIQFDAVRIQKYISNACPQHRNVGLQVLAILIPETLRRNVLPRIRKRGTWRSVTLAPECLRLQLVGYEVDGTSEVACRVCSVNRPRQHAR